MASPVTAAVLACIAAGFWTFIGYALLRHFLPRAVAIGAAPAVGWAAFSAVALPVFTLIGFSPLPVGAVAALCVALGAASLKLLPAEKAAASPNIPAATFIAAAALALVPAVAILPKFAAGGVHLADPIFDHSKIAIIDAMMRQGLPPPDPVFAGVGVAGRLVYYYLWHFSAAALALPLRASGWEADVGLTWFTAFASLTLMMGLAVWLSKQPGAAIWVVVFAAAASLRTTLSLICGSYGLQPLLAVPTGFAGWLFQSAWVPQHLMSATCVIAALSLIVAYAQRQKAGLLPILALVIAAGFESSAYVGGITFAIAAIAAAPIIFAAIAPGRRVRAALGLAAAAVLVAGFAAPFIRDQLNMVAARGGGSPLTLHPFDVLGSMFAPPLRRVFDLPAYWLILLPVEFPATLLAGIAALVVLVRRTAPGPEKTVAAVFIVLAAAGLCVSWLLVGTLGDNNDLGLRAVLPAAMVLIVGAAAGMLLMPRRSLIIVSALCGFALSLPDTIVMIGDNALGSPAPDAALFAQGPDLWSAVRRHAAPAARVANNPLYLQDMTPWPANMSWALFADRSSCFAGRELVLALAPLPASRREAIDAQFIRVFDGKGSAADVVVIVPQDGAWTSDPFAASPDYYRLAEFRDHRWRIYTRVTDKSAPR